MTLFWGQNGQGKTNIVEAVRVLANLSSHRTNSTEALIKDGFNKATLIAKINSSGRSVKIGLVVNRIGPNQAFVNGSKVNLSELPFWLSAIMFAPEDFAIVRGDPSLRRGFLNDIIVGVKPVSMAMLRDYDRILKQRNTLLKTLRTSSKNSSLSTLESWTGQLIAVGTEIVITRIKIIQELSPIVKSEYSKLADGHNISMEYSSKYLGPVSEKFTKIDVAELLEKEFSSRQSDEVERGVTLVGPHRDDLELSIEGKPARTHASQGETWSLALALRLATASYIDQQRTTGFPILILDDVFAELDINRRKKLVEAINKFEQTLITAAIRDDVPSGLAGTGYRVADGVVDSQ